MRLFFILSPMIIVSQLSLIGCQTSSGLSHTAEAVNEVGTNALSIQNITPKVAEFASSPSSKSVLNPIANTTPNVVGTVTDSLGYQAGDVTSDSMSKPAFSVGGMFSGLMVAVGLKDSPTEVAAKEQLKAAKDFAASQIIRTQSVIIEASIDANGDAKGQGFSTISRFYALQDRGAFNKIGVEETSDHNILPYQEELILPNHSTQIRVKYPSDSQFIAVLFQLHNRAHRWRLLIPVKQLQSDKPLRLVLGRCDVRVKDGLLSANSASSIQMTESVKKTQAPVIEAELSTACQ